MKNKYIDVCKISVDYCLYYLFVLIVMLYAAGPIQGNDSNYPVSSVQKNPESVTALKNKQSLSTLPVIETKLKEIQKQYIPDTRLDVFEWSFTNDILYLRTTSSQAKQAVQQLLKTDFTNLKSHLILLPEENEILHNNYYGIAALSTITMRKLPDYAAEVGTQAIMGMPIRVLDQVENSYWLLIQNQDGYLGYVTRGSVKRMTKEEFNSWVDAPKRIWQELFGLVYSQPNKTSQTISDLVMGAVMVDLKEESNGFCKVQLPHGTVGWIQKDSSLPFDEWLAGRQMTPDNIVKTAKRLLGFPYLWGGTTVKGIDCSGFVSVTMFLNRTTVLRDASQLQRLGKCIDISRGYENCQSGDLLFFGQKKVDGTLSFRHVAIYLGDGRFIHSATFVRINSLDPAESDFDPSNCMKQVVKVVRLAGEPEHRFFCPVSNNPFYQKVK